MKKFPPIGILALVMCGSGCAQSPVHTQFKSPNNFSQDQVAAGNSLSWVNQANKAWTGDNKPYHQVRGSIDTAIAKGQPVDDLRQQYGLAALQKPNDPVAQFAWAYSSWLASQSRTITDGKAYEDLWGVMVALSHVRDPHAYDFYRLRFLLGGGPKLLPVGRRLMKVNPNDLAVRVQSIRMSPDIKSNIAECNRLIEAYPQNAQYHAILGDEYTYAWIKTHDEADRLRAIAATDDFLRLSLPSDTRLGNARYWMKLLAAPAHSG